MSTSLPISDMPRAIAHWLICSVAIVLFAISATTFCLIIFLSLLGDKVWPNATMGNCWSHVLPLWWRTGGYIAIRRADNVALCKWLPVPHALHIARLPRSGVKLSQFVPIKRKQPHIFPAIVGYYVGEVRTVEAPHNATQE